MTDKLGGAPFNFAVSIAKSGGESFAVSLLYNELDIEPHDAQNDAQNDIVELIAFWLKQKMFCNW